jgi:hypothetical protein
MSSISTNRDIDVAAASKDPSLWRRFRSMSPIYQAGIVLGAALVLWVAAEDYVWAPARSLNLESERIARALRDGANREAVIRGVGESIRPVGRVVVPRAENDGSEELFRSVNEVCNEHNIVARIDVRPGGSMNAPAELASLIGENNRLGKVTCDLTFTTSQETFAKFLADLEARPEIESVSRLKIARNDKDKKIDVLMTVDAWVQVPKKQRAGGMP